MWHNGLLDLSVMQLVLVTFVMTHITIVSVTLYLHRHSAHNSLDLHPALKHFFRFWLWFTTAQNTKEWTAIHLSLINISEPTRLRRISYARFCLKKKKIDNNKRHIKKTNKKQNKK